MYKRLEGASGAEFDAVASIPLRVQCVIFDKKQRGFAGICKTEITMLYKQRKME